MMGEYEAGALFLVASERDKLRDRVEEYKREVERRDEYLAGADADLKAEREKTAALERELQQWRDADLVEDREKCELDLEISRLKQERAKLEAKVSELTAENERLLWPAFKAACGECGLVPTATCMGFCGDCAGKHVAAERDRIAKVLERRSDDLMHITTEGLMNQRAQEVCAVALKKAAEAIRRGE